MVDRSGEMNETVGREYLVKKLGERGMSRRHSLRVLNFLFKEMKRKRPEFPSGMSLGMRPSMRSWVLQRKRDLDDRCAGGGRYRRSGG